LHSTRIALGISYLGTAYHGWQSQLDGQTVQDKVESALNRFADTTPERRIGTICAGRTDAGVHGHMQVIHFDTDVVRDETSWVRGVNASLPKDIAVQWARQVPQDFHCRAAAVTRRYAYALLESNVRPSLDARRVGWAHRPLEADTMRRGADYLIGQHDFSSFRAAQCQALSPIKHLHRINIASRGERVPYGDAQHPQGQRYWRFEFEGNAFLHHMIRNIMGCLIAIGQGAHPPEWMREVLEAKNRKIAAPTFSPDGLYFLGPTYDAKWGIPQTPLFAYGLI
jgi:tRNA pseudouridine38-40 synthase